MWKQFKIGVKENGDFVYKYLHEDGRVRVVENGDNTYNVQVAERLSNFRRHGHEGYLRRMNFDTLAEACKDACKWNTVMEGNIKAAFEHFKATGEVRSIVLEGGNAFSDVGTIHISEIEPTLTWMEKEFGLSNLADRVLGSVGKVEYSGDIDVALDTKNTDPTEFSTMLRTKLGDQSVTGTAGNITIRAPIANYDKTKDGRQPRTGFVQVDFLPGDPAWLKTFFHSPGDASKFKGIHRNMAMTAVANLLGAKSTKEQDDFDRPVSTVRWQWGLKNGLVKVRKSSRKNKNTGKWVKKQDTEILGEPVTDPKKIAHVLFKGKAGPEAIDSMETIIDAVKKSHTPKETDAFYRKLAQTLSYSNIDMITGYDIPAEVAQYVEGQ